MGRGKAATHITELAERRLPAVHSAEIPVDRSVLSKCFVNIAQGTREANGNASAVRHRVRNRSFGYRYYRYAALTFVVSLLGILLLEWRETTTNLSNESQFLGSRYEPHLTPPLSVPCHGDMGEWRYSAIVLGRGTRWK
jgi:hypothetical protein